MLLSSLALGLTLTVSAPLPSPTALLDPIALPSLSPASTPAPHCQVPCGIYGDKLRIDLLMEDLRTVEKAMAQITELSAADTQNVNQIVRWVVNKEEHAQKVQDQVAAYWLAQRIKAPSTDSERGGYLRKLELLHGITVAAMKCKQTTDSTNVVRARELSLAFSDLYFDAGDAKHLRENHGGGEHDGHGH